MKKLMLTIASLLFVSLMAVNAQVSTDTSSVSGQPPVSDDMSNYTRDMEVIQSSEVPASLRSTLQGSEYAGWEEGKVYRNSTTNEYLIVIGDEDAKVYRFDANGSKIEDSPADSNSGSTDTGAGSTNDASTPADSSTPSTPGSTDGSTPGSTDGSTPGSTDGSTPGSPESTSPGSTSDSTGTSGSGSTAPPSDK